ncbi:MAG: ATP-dependent protease ATPase subunit HslU [Treponema sp.]
MNLKLDDLTPKQIVEELDKYIIGQSKAKRAVAVAIRNRSRRLHLPEEIRDEISPKNILMIGPTGVGKTEISRRLAKISGAPFLKVEATKYTEVGYVGRDVESMVRDLTAVAYSIVKLEMQEDLRFQAEKNTEEILLDLLLPSSAKKKTSSSNDVSKERIFESVVQQPELSSESSVEEDSTLSTREKFRQMLVNGELEDKIVEVKSERNSNKPSFEFFAGGANIEDIEAAMNNITNMMMDGGRKSKKKNVSIKEARQIILDDQLDKMVDNDKIREQAKERVEQMGIIFIDEIDKVASTADNHSIDVSREGVQRDILPIVEGSKVNTKLGIIDTSHILFIAAGAFNVSKPSDLIPEFQGRFPLRVELESLHATEFKRILLEPKNSLTRQYSSLLETEGVKISFTDAAIDRMSFLAEDLNSKMENIGARRLHTIMEMLLEDISFNASDMKGQEISIDVDYVDERLKSIVQDRDLSRYIL